jgi:hypothetical protein
MISLQHPVTGRFVVAGVALAAVLRQMGQLVADHDRVLSLRCHSVARHLESSKVIGPELLVEVGECSDRLHEWAAGEQEAQP